MLHQNTVLQSLAPLGTSVTSTCFVDCKNIYEIFTKYLGKETAKKKEGRTRTTHFI